MDTASATTQPSYARGEAEPPLLDATIYDNFVETAEKYGDNLAIADAAAGREWTYREMLHDVHALAAGLLRRGVKRGDRVGVWSPNRAEWVLAQYATAALGVVLVNINPSYRQNELDFALRHVGISLVLSSPAFKDSDYPTMVGRSADSLDEPVGLVVFGSPEWTALLAEPTEAELDAVAQAAAACAPDDPINIQFTSGTTGAPKGATLTHRNIVNNGYLVGELVGYTDADRICIPVPFYHCFGMVMGNLAATTHGAAMVIPAPAFDPAATLAAVSEYRCTSLYGVPTMFIAELALPGFADYDLSSLRTGIMAGSPCPEQVMREVVDRMHMDEVSICYGMTETSPVSTQTRVDDELALRVGTVGRVGPHLEIKVVDPVTGETVPRGEAGEFCTRGYSVMIGYWNQPDKTAEAIDGDGWMHTGDIAVMAENGYVQITGRIKDMVIRGGENIYPREIEEFLYTHPDILDAQVIGVPDQKYGEELMAWVRLRDGVADFTVEDLRAFADGKIARHKIPKYVHVVDEFPMTVTGKVRKVDMRAEAVELLGLA
ncbi:AMP-binding protein [Gordonia sp. X0973]|uniref:AMP-binding protein n=1 Tax=Gordonia sp. X0973 TaxID=2742602 RepID=UPI000F52418D|nr:AMP-binding protein [Gordonia sp. X0973]QKT06424.1 AMP-binding protein [Gordonia sp. X0973]